MEKHDIAGLKIDGITKEEFLNKVRQRLTSGTKTFVITPYSEFLYHSLQDPTLLETFNKADFAVPDGIGIFWAARFLSIPLTVKNYYLKIIQAFWHMVYSGAAIIFYPRYVRTALTNYDGRHKIIEAEKISGSDVIWDLAKLASQNNWSVYLLGGFGNTPQLVANQLISQSANGITIAGWSSKNPDDPRVVDDINKANPTMVFVAYGPLKQEKWIVENIDALNAKFFIGLGGTFDYIAGVRVSPPKFIRSLGLEWLYRLVTQPHRFKRIINATVGLITALTRYKVLMSMPYRQNVVAVIVNNKNEFLICKRKPYSGITRAYGDIGPSQNNFWQFPQGGVNPHEPIVEAAKREALEETGLKNLELLNVSKKTYVYNWFNGRRHLFKISQKFKGQSQNIVYFKLLDSQEKITLDNIEFEEYQWVTMDQLQTKLHEFRKPLIPIIQEDLANHFQ